MHRPAPLRGRSPFDGRKVLLIDEKQAIREARANVLRSHGVEVDAAASLQRARVLWKPHRYDLVLLDVRHQFPGEALQFYEQIRDASPRQRFAFLVGPPLYVYVRRAAIVGAESLPKVFYEALQTFSRREFPRFKTREEALDWLVREAA